LVNTVTLYRSPVRLVKHVSEDVSIYSSQAISRARKRLMAEIMLIGDEIVIDDVPYSRNDASTLLDVITEENWKTHSIIYNQKGLLDFLEKETFNDEELKKADAYLYNERFVQALSPYFAHSFNAVSGKLIRQQNFEELYQLLNYQGYILPEHSHEGYQKIRNYLDELIYTLRNLSWEKFFADESILHFIFSAEWKRFLNKLPSSFTSLRDDVVEQMIGIVLRFQHKATWYYLHQVLVQLKTIETNDYNRSEVERIDQIISENSRVESRKGSSRTTTKKDSEVSTGRIIWWVIWVVLILVRAATCNERTNNNMTTTYEDYNLSRERQRLQSMRIDEERNVPLLLQFLDSLGSKPSLAIGPVTAQPKTGSQPLGTFADEFSNRGEDTVRILNNTGYDCVAMYIKAGGRPGSVYEGALPNIAAVYIRNGEGFSFHHNPDGGKFHFFFGEKWGQLKKQTELAVYSERGYSNDSGRRHLVFLYEFFSSKKPVRQNYLMQPVYLQEASGYSERNEIKYNYLNNPYEAALNQATEMNLQQEGGRFSIKAKGSLLVKEEKADDHQSFIEIGENSGVKKQKNR
jgi:hypothetical protein